MSINIREAPGTDAKDTGKNIDLDETVEVLEKQPICADGSFWYKIKKRLDGCDDAYIEGWAAEGKIEEDEKQNYWLVPLADGSTCELSSQLVPGDQAIAESDDRIRIRAAPGTKADEIVNHIYNGQTVRVLEGPVCVDELNWYKIRSDDCVIGWVAEGKIEENGERNYWFVTPTPAR